MSDGREGGREGGREVGRRERRKGREGLAAHIIPKLTRPSFKTLTISSVGKRSYDTQCV